MLGKLAELKDKINEGRIGFQMDEIMSGEHEFEPGMGPEGKHAFEFCVTWGPEDISSWINPQSENFMTQPLQGTITAGGLCNHAPCRGTLKLAYFSEHKIRYIFDFKAKGTDYQFIGEKVNIKPWNLPVSHTTCFGTVVEKETNKLVSRSVTFFRMRTAPAFMTSFRII